MRQQTTYDDPFRRGTVPPRREAAVDRFPDLHLEPYDPTLPWDQWTEEQRRGAAFLNALRVILLISVLGCVAAAAVMAWRLSGLT
jgi:hypothetical protein